MLCRCEDVTLADVERAVRTGFADLEEVKRYTGFGTGPCQGKSCVQACMQLIADETHVDLDDLDVMTFRPPVRPISFATLAAPDATQETTKSTNPTKGPEPVRAMHGTRGPDAGPEGTT